MSSCPLDRRYTPACCIENFLGLYTWFVKLATVIWSICCIKTVLRLRNINVVPPFHMLRLVSGGFSINTTFEYTICSLWTKRKSCRAYKELFLPFSIFLRRYSWFKLPSYFTHFSYMSKGINHWNKRKTNTQIC